MGKNNNGNTWKYTSVRGIFERGEFTEPGRDMHKIWVYSTVVSARSGDNKVLLRLGFA